MVHLEKVLLEFLEKLCIRIAMRTSCSPDVALRRLFWVISFGIWLTKLVLYWPDKRQRLRIPRLQCRLEYINVIV
jgi:hypothetical protein